MPFLDADCKEVKYFACGENFNQTETPFSLNSRYASVYLIRFEWEKMFITLTRKSRVSSRDHVCRTLSFFLPTVINTL